MDRSARKAYRNMGGVFFCLVGRLEKINREDCPLVAFNMDQMMKLSEAQQLGLGTLLDWISHGSAFKGLWRCSRKFLRK